MKVLKLRKIYFILILVLLSYGNTLAQETKLFSEAKGSQAAVNEVYDYENWSFSISGDKYEIDKSGRGKRTKGNNFVYEIDKSGRGKRTKGNNFVEEFSFSIEDANYIDRVIYFAEYKNDLLLVGELNFGDGGAGFIVQLDGKTLKPLWREHIPAFNVAKGLIEDNSAYLAAIGFAAKINLDTGKYIWKHSDFYRKYKESGAFNIFEAPVIKGDTVIYTENQGDYERPPNIIRFNKINGKVIEVKVN